MARPKKYWVRALGDAMNLATTVAACVVLGYFFGKWLDGKFGTEPWLTVAGFLVGVIAGMKAMWQMLERSSSDDKKQKDRN